MTSWRDEYLDALKAQDECRNRDYDLIDTYTRLADRTAALEAEVAAAASPSTTVSNRDRVQNPALVHGAVQLRSDLAEALRSKGQLLSRLRVAEEELNKSREKNKSGAKTIRDFSSERVILMTKVRDRDEELRGKAKLLEDVQNEMVSLNLQLNMAEQRSLKLTEENDYLVKRWMARVGQEADDMNNASKFS